jgi:hypothetical protein
MTEQFSTLNLMWLDIYHGDFYNHRERFDKTSSYVGLLDRDNTYHYAYTY